MVNEAFDEGLTLPKPGGLGAPAVIAHQIHLTRHGIVQGWTTAGGRPVAVVDQRSTYGHEVDSIIGFLRLGNRRHQPCRSWLVGQPRSATRSTG